MCRGHGRAAAIPKTCGGGQIPICAADAGLVSYTKALFITRLPGSVSSGIEH